MTKANFGVVGMAVMGRNLALNIESRGYTVAIYNRSKEKTEDVIACHPEKNFVPSYDVESFVNSIEKPRRIMLMVKLDLVQMLLSKPFFRTLTRVIS
ncbi:6-phosphogluconate dehydrogenase [Streptococcus pneumoniae SP11-BS70]|nr:6-phosphogluconate dehydrogenase [Streptococcus pneumoniae SP11-BS70]